MNVAGEMVNGGRHTVVERTFLSRERRAVMEVATKSLNAQAVKATSHSRGRSRCRRR